MMSSEQLERQSEQSRAEVELTIDELRARLTPGQIVDEILCYAKDGGQHFLSNLGRQATNNPMPVVLMGAGLAWFLFGRDATSSVSTAHHRSTGDYAANAGHGLGDMASKAGDTMHDAMGSARETAHDAMDGMRHAAESASSAVSGTAQRLGETASSAYHSASSKVSDTAHKVADSATALEQKAMMAARDLAAQIKDQPLVLAGIGLALGALIGAAFPATDMENRVMGDTADELKRDVKQTASQKLDEAKDAAKRYVEENVDVRGNGSERADGPPRAEHFG